MSMSDTRATSIQRNRAAAHRFLEDIWSKGDLAAVDEIVDPNFEFILAFATVKGADSFKGMVTRNREAFRDLTYIVEDSVMEDDKGAVYWRMHSTHVGTWRGIAPTNKDVAIEGMTFFYFADGKIVRAKVQNDVMGLMRQMGAVPEFPAR